MLEAARTAEWSKVRKLAEGARPAPISPEQWSAALADADQQFDAGRYQEAVNRLESLVKQYPTAAEPRAHLAQALHRAGNPSAKDVVGQALTAQPDFGRGWLIAAEIFADTGAADLAVEAMALAIFFARDRQRALNSIAAMAASPRTPELGKVLKQALVLAPGIPSR